jgi:hypothetical protein
MERCFLFAALVLVACSGPEPVEHAQADPAPAPPTPTGPCESFTRSDCLRSSHCTLEFVEPGVYRCRPDQGSCEVGIGQSDRVACEGVAGCRFDQGSCYCPFNGYGRTAVPDPPATGGACACGGGPPPSCVPTP